MLFAPDDSVWGQNATVFFSHLIALLYTCNYADSVYLCGDYNARIGQGNEVIDGIDELPERKVLDKTKNAHGEAMLDF